MRDDLLCQMKAFIFLSICIICKQLCPLLAYIDTVVTLSHLQLMMLTALLTIQSIVLQLMCYIQSH